MDRHRMTVLLDPDCSAGVQLVWATLIAALPGCEPGLAVQTCQKQRLMRCAQSQRRLLCQRPSLTKAYTGWSHDRCPCGDTSCGPALPPLWLSSSLSALCWKVSSLLGPLPLCAVLCLSHHCTVRCSVFCPICSGLSLATGEFWGAAQLTLCLLLLAGAAERRVAAAGAAQAGPRQGGTRQADGGPAPAAAADQALQRREQRIRGQGGLCGRLLPSDTFGGIVISCTCLFMAPPLLAMAVDGRSDRALRVVQVVGTCHGGRLKGAEGFAAITSPNRRDSLRPWSPASHG